MGGQRGGLQLDPCFPVYEDRTAVIVPQALDTFESCRFSCAIDTEQRKNFSPFDLKIHSLENHMAAIAFL